MELSFDNNTGIFIIIHETLLLLNRDLCKIFFSPSNNVKRERETESNVREK